jgi:hypothetical protein
MDVLGSSYEQFICCGSIKPKAVPRFNQVEKIFSIALLNGWILGIKNMLIFYSRSFMIGIMVNKTTNFIKKTRRYVKLRKAKNA